MHVYTSSRSPLGPWSYEGQINRLGNGSVANAPRVNAQQATVVNVAGSGWIWVGDRWAHSPTGQKGTDPQAWLPLEWGASGKLEQLEWQSEWAPHDHAHRN